MTYSHPLKTSGFPILRFMKNTYIDSLKQLLDQKINEIHIERIDFLKNILGNGSWYKIVTHVLDNDDVSYYKIIGYDDLYLMFSSRKFIDRSKQDNEYIKITHVVCQMLYSKNIHKKLCIDDRLFDCSDQIKNKYDFAKNIISFERWSNKNWWQKINCPTKFKLFNFIY